MTSDISQAVVVRNMVFKLSAGAERYGVYYNVVVDIIRVQVGGDHNLVIITPSALFLSVLTEC